MPAKRFVVSIVTSQLCFDMMTSLYSNTNNSPFDRLATGCRVDQPPTLFMLFAQADSGCGPKCRQFAIDFSSTDHSHFAKLLHNALERGVDYYQ